MWSIFYPKHILRDYDFRHDSDLLAYDYDIPIKKIESLLFDTSLDSDEEGIDSNKILQSQFSHNLSERRYF